MLFWVGALWLARVHLTFAQPRERPEEFVVSSSAVRIERRKPVPQPHLESAKPVPQTRAQRPAIAYVRPRQRAPERKRHVVPSPNGNIQQAQLAEQIAQQEQAYTREAQRLHAQNNPLSVATLSPEQTSSTHKSTFNISGKLQRDGVEAILMPYKHWFDGGASCYYVRYDAEFTAGGSEQGLIPWPICYPRVADRMLPLDRPHPLPIPYPPEGFALKGNTYLTPLLRSVYERRIPTPQATPKD